MSVFSYKVMFLIFHKIKQVNLFVKLYIYLYIYFEFFISTSSLFVYDADNVQVLQPTQKTRRWQDPVWQQEAAKPDQVPGKKNPHPKGRPLNRSKQVNNLASPLL